MSLRKRRIWSPDRSWREVAQDADTLRQRCQAQGLLPRWPTPTLYPSIRLPGAWPDDAGVPMSSALRVGAEPSPQRDRMMTQACALLACATHAHAVLAPDAVVPEEPVLWSIPDAAQPGLSRWAMVYQLRATAAGRTTVQSLMIASWDMRFSASRHLSVTRADRWVWALARDAGTWVTPLSWETEHQKAAAAGWLGTEVDRQRLLSALRAAAPGDLPRWGRPVSLPPAQKDLAHLVGAIWAAAARTWMLPHGAASDTHVQWIDDRLAADPAEVWRQYTWVTGAPFPAHRPPKT